MKKIRTVLILLTFMLLFPLNVFAENSIKLDANKTGNPGDEITFTLTENFDNNLSGKIKKIEFRVTVDDPNGCLETDIQNKKDSKVINNWMISNRNNTFILSKESNGAELFSGSTFIDLTFEIKSTAKIDDVINITIDNVKYYYDTDIGSSSESNIVEESIDGQGNSKSITVKKKKEVSSVIKSNIALLESLTISQGVLNPIFDPEVTTYNVNVKDTITRLTINAVCSSNCSSINQNTNGIYKNQINLAKNEITSVTITVISEDGMNAKNYYVNIARGEVINDSANLKTLSIAEGDINPVFDPNTLQYTLNVGKDVTEVNIKYTLLNEDATAEVIGGKNLTGGENIVKINVTSDDNSTKTYIITINKEEEVSSDIVSSSTIAPIEDETNNSISTKKLFIIILIIFVALAVIGISFYFIFKNGKKKKETVKKELLEEKPQATISHDNDQELVELTKEFNVMDNQVTENKNETSTIDSNFDKFN